ncbi:uncharacterized protein LOC125242398 [Leguminivora glycinivorella]|uniref:uncharacterized protein LOC125242398 n=1 Tax=Leguminivora glycinivorella TaxID=1035111 RepID=UPI00200FD8B1|nr:uncharacterized protein LOC125242398 [Leguminivora glycinivorella]
MFSKLFSLILVLITPQVENRPELTCDSIKHQPFQEGNLGQTGIVSWLGVIRAHLHLGGKTQIAVTGAILVKPRHAIANADDMSKIRKQGDSKAMFISHDRGIWTCKLSEVSLHPEYDFATYNTIALVELDTESLTNNAPMLPVCMPKYMYNTSNQLYALGFTDENRLLEKVAYKVQYVEKPLCDEFYERAGHGKGMYTPKVYECAFAENNMKNCEWENGMALVSNASGYWVLVGFGVQGPGCSAPARFIDIYNYFHWIESASNIEDFDADYPFKVKVRRSDDSPLLSYENITETIEDNYFKKDSVPLNITFWEFIKEKGNETRLFGYLKDQKDIEVKKLNDTSFVIQD